MKAIEPAFIPRINQHATYLFKLLIVALIVASFLDTITTWYALTYTSLIESNPLGPVLPTLLKALLIVVVSLIYYLSKHFNFHGAPWMIVQFFIIGFLIFSSVAFFYAGLHNLLLILVYYNI